MKRLHLIPLTLLLGMIVCAFTGGCGASSSDNTASRTGKHLLVVMPNGFGVNSFLARDEFERYGWTFTTAGLTDTVRVCKAFAEPRGALSPEVDTLLQKIDDLSTYNGIVLISSTQWTDQSPYGDVLSSEPALDVFRLAVRESVPVAASCAGVRVLAAIDAIRDKEVGGSPKFADEYEAAGATFVGNDHPPVTDGRIITSARGMYYNVVNCQAIALLLEKREDRTSTAPAISTERVRSTSIVAGADSILWAKTFGGASSDGARAVCATDDGGFLLAGYTFSHGSDNADMLVIKIDAEGTPVWSRTYGGSGTEYANGCATLDDGYVITGYTTSYGSGTRDVCLVRLTTDGDTLWTGTYGGPGWDVGNSVTTANDGSLLICGYTSSSGEGEEDIYLIKVDAANGSEIWAQTYGGARSEMGNAVWINDDGTLTISAVTGTFGGKNCDFYIVRTDAEGNQIRTGHYAFEGQHGHGFDWCESGIALPGGGCVLVGHSDCNDLMDAAVTRLEADGEVRWSKAFGSSFYDYGTSVCQSPDGGIIACGTTKNPEGNNDILLTHLDAEGELIGQRIIGGPKSEWGSSVCMTEDGMCLVVGHTKSYGAGLFDMYVAKVAVP